MILSCRPIYYVHYCRKEYFPDDKMGLEKSYRGVGEVIFARAAKRDNFLHNSNYRYSVWLDITITINKIKH